MKQQPTFMEVMDELEQANSQTDAMLSMLMINISNAGNGDESLSNTDLSNYVWALQVQNERTERALSALLNAAP